MNYIDILIVIILAIAMIKGFIEGFVKEVASLVALILGIWAAIKFSTFTAAKLHDYFDMTGKYVGIIAFIITFVVVVAAVHFTGLIIDKLIKAIALGFVNRLLGMVFGLFKSALILSVIFVILNTIDEYRPFLPKEKINQSMLYNPISDIAPALFPIIGEGVFSKSFERFKKKPDEVVI
ncbi:MAG: CvpA family protein [Bacteroidales bacterium]